MTFSVSVSCISKCSFFTLCFMSRYSPLPSRHMLFYFFWLTLVLSCCRQSALPPSARCRQRWWKKKICYISRDKNITWHSCSGWHELSEQLEGVWLRQVYWFLCDLWTTLHYQCSWPFSCLSLQFGMFTHLFVFCSFLIVHMLKLLFCFVLVGFILLL